MKTKNQIIDEMVAHFANNQRAMEGLDCVYLTDDGKRCGHSIFIDDKFIGNLMNREDSAETVIEEYGDQIHKPEYRGHCIEFWIDVQEFHDIDSNWQPNSKGGNDLTEAGKLQLEELKTKWK